MNSYNIAVTVGPNIFRPLTVRPADLFNAGTYYDVVIRMMESFDILFNGAEIPNAKDFDLLAQAEDLNDVGAMQHPRQISIPANSNAIKHMTNQFDTTQQIIGDLGAERANSLLKSSKEAAYDNIDDPSVGLASEEVLEQAQQAAMN